MDCHHQGRSPDVRCAQLNCDFILSYRIKVWADEFSAVIKRMETDRGEDLLCLVRQEDWQESRTILGYIVKIVLKNTYTHTHFVNLDMKLGKSQCSV